MKIHAALYKLQIHMKNKAFVIVFCFLSFALSLLGQNNIVKGTVLDELGQPLTGVTIMLKGGTVGTSTDIDGNFTIKVPGSNEILKISYIGFKPKDVKAKFGQQMKIVLEEDAQNLSEVQVIGYGQQSKVSVTGAVTSIGTAELLKAPVSNVANILAGNLSGVSSVQYSGQPGADNPEIFVRGVATLNSANSTPLIMVDGVERDLFNLDPNEIESISVLKDASATAVFGVRGANGVIIVTTRRGEEGPARISFSTSFGTQQPTRLVDFADSYDWATYYNEAMRNDGKEPGFSPEVMEAFRTGSDPLMYPNTDWMAMLFKKNAMQSQHNVNVSGGTKRVRYFTSLGYLTQDGMFKNYDKRYDANFYFNRFNFRTNIDVDFTKTTQLALNLGGRNEVRNNPNSGTELAQLFRSIYWATPFSGAGIVDGKWIKKNSRYLPIGDNDGLAPYYGKGFTNKTTNVLNIDLQLKQDLDFVTKGLSFRIKGSYNGGYDHTKTRSASIASYTPWVMKDLTWLEPIPEQDREKVVLIKSGDEGTLGYGESFGRGRDWYAEASFNYNRKFGDHNVSGLVLYNQSRVYYPSTYQDIPRGYVGLVGRATYNYKTRYLADVNVGYNGSENFSKDHRYGLFPAFSLGWVVTNEPFMQGQTIIDYLKVRGSYGVVGNDKDYDGSTLRRFLYLEGQYGSGSGYYFGTNSGSAKPGMEEKKLGNPLIGWEKAYKQNYGVDMFFLQNRLGVNIDVFYEHRKDILVTPNASNPLYNGMSLPTLNLGEVENKGMEVTLKWKDKITKDFSYNVTLNLSYAKNKIINSDEVLTPYSYQWKTGKPVGQQFGKKFVGFYYEGMENVATHPGTLYPGDCVYQDINGDGIIDGLDDVAIGYPNYPLLNGGLNLGITYRNFSITAMFAGATKTSRLLSETFRIPLGDTFSRSLLQSQFDNRWTPETASTATEPRPSLNSYANNFRNASDLWIRDASYIRLKNVEVSYNMKFGFMKTIGLKSLRVFANGYNLFTLDKLKIADPETRTSDRPTYPAMRIFNMGLNASF